MIIKVVKLNIIKLGTLFKVYRYDDILFYYMAKPDLGKSQRSGWFFSVGILQYGPFPWKRSKPCIVFWSKAGKFIIGNNFI